MDGSQWQIIKPLSEGGQAHTFLAQRRDSAESKFVYKRLKNVNSQARIERFRREIEHLQALAHPRIVPYIDHGEDSKGKPFVVMPYFPNGTLEAMNPPISLNRAIEIIGLIAEPLAYLHERDVVHRDLKPSNILLDENREPVLADFGLAIHLDEAHRLTQTQEVIGARNYLAPELEGGRTPPAPTADVYSLGKLFYWLLTGRILPREQHRDPSWQPTPEAAQQQHREMASRLLDSLLAFNPTQRPPNARAAADAIAMLRNKIVKGGHVLDLTLRHDCSFCMEGAYQVVVAPQGPKKKQSNEWSFPLLSANFNIATPIILVCDHCGHIQLFKPDLTATTQNWRFD